MFSENCVGELRQFRDGITAGGGEAVSVIEHICWPLLPRRAGGRGCGQHHHEAKDGLVQPERHMYCGSNRVPATQLIPVLSWRPIICQCTLSLIEHEYSNECSDWSGSVAHIR